MRETPLQVWDGRRPRLPRAVVRRREARIGRIGIVAATENLRAATDWCFEEEHHTIVAHLDGRLDRMDCTFSIGPSGRAIPSRGDLWIIPAGCRYAALAQGEHARFVELTIPATMLGDTPIKARVRHRDDFLFGAAARLSDLIERPDDDLARMAAHAIADAVHLHLREHHASRNARAGKRRLSPADLTILAGAIGDQLDTHHSLSSLAALVDMDVRRFTAAFTDGFGLTPWQYILRARLEQATHLLHETDDRVTDIALAVGFATPSHFATTFARHFGVPPSRYRAVQRR
ncbi:helix-turn-helix domain-containing protein [Sphingomonas colocasiae]|uniref:AraC family transcriptional regulator n=1 Tax=Sphingomonas colocasiae TaxID=1848973 RepID=A0ABS7PZR5_9SPHN|nr:AraC family transcriptional regulator [Sphingomonas colocasiae]MBY8825812.1 AraC family transcriptional regulator [Sphingomonas colocasiae]